MDTKDFKHIVGEVKTGQPAIIRLFDSIWSGSASRFTDEFLWLHDYIKPSKIIVLINSEGGSCVSGMSIFSVISSSEIEVDCVIEGLAASMGSVIWLAGDNLFMHDYSLLMIHNPFSMGGDSDDLDTQNMIRAFRSQLETIYCKRLGFSKEKVKSIMEGEEGADGTFFTASEAVKAGIISKDMVLKTNKSICQKAKNAAENIEDLVKIRESMSSIAAELDLNKIITNPTNNVVDITPEVQDNKPINKPKTTLNQKANNKLLSTMNENNLSFSAMAAILGFNAETPTSEMTQRVSALLQAEKDVTALTAALNDTKILLQGKEAELETVNANLSAANDKLQGYVQAEKTAAQAKINQLVDGAIEAGKITSEVRQTWIDMAASNLTLTEQTLASIPSREKLSAAIGADAQNQNNGSISPAEAELQAKVEAVVGKDFQLKTRNK